MKVYLALSPYHKIFEIMERNKVKNVLISYAYYKTLETYQTCARGWFPDNMILDSGAFSVWSKGDTINIDNYIAWCKDIIREAPPDKNINIVNLDVLPGKFGSRPTQEERDYSVKQGWENMLYMESKGLKVIHVFHQHEDFEWLHKMMEHLGYIGISPANDVSMKEKMAWLNKVFAITKNKIKTHGFAVTSHKQVLNFPFYSVDSSSWNVGARYGRIPTFSEGKMKILQFKQKSDMGDLSRNASLKEGALLDNYLKRSEQGARAFQELEKFANDIWRRRGVTLPE